MCAADHADSVTQHRQFATATSTATGIRPVPCALKFAPAALAATTQTLCRSLETANAFHLAMFTAESAKQNAHIAGQHNHRARPTFNVFGTQMR